jgi:hypothetical protein
MPVPWTQVVSRRPLTVTRVCYRYTTSRIFSEQSDTGTGYSPSYSVFCCQYYSTVASQSYLLFVY